MRRTLHGSSYSTSHISLLTTRANHVDFDQRRFAFFSIAIFLLFSLRPSVRSIFSLSLSLCRLCEPSRFSNSSSTSFFPLKFKLHSPILLAGKGGSWLDYRVTAQNRFIYPTHKLWTFRNQYLFIKLESVKFTTN